MVSKTFCADPWSTVFIGINNEVKTCCAASETLGDLTKNSITEILNGKKAQEIKTAILNNEWHPSCSGCEKLEDTGSKSYRNQVYDNVLLDEIAQDPYYFKPITLDVRWNNTCALACNYCNEYFSSTWSNIKKIKPLTNRNYYPETLAWIDQHKDSVQGLLLLGGEPLLTKETSQLVKLFVDQPVKLTIVTGLAMDLEKSEVFKDLSKFKQITLDISFENVGDRYNYVRHNASWDTLVKNIETLSSMDNIVLCVDPIYSIYNATDLLNFYRFISKYNLSLRWMRVHHPSELDVTLFEPKVKELAIKEIDLVLAEFKDYERGDLNFLRDVKENLRSPVASCNTAKHLSGTCV
jgi:sulfatase maturation enzyme AslB (radical SAM superfamily)